MASTRPFLILPKGLSASADSSPDRQTKFSASSQQTIVERIDCAGPIVACDRQMQGVGCTQASPIILQITFCEVEVPCNRQQHFEQRLHEFFKLGVGPAGIFSRKYTHPHVAS